MTKLVVGRVETLEGGQKVISPLVSHKEVALKYQNAVAALIAAAYLYKAEHSFESVERLKRAAEALSD